MEVVQWLEKISMPSLGRLEHLNERKIIKMVNGAVDEMTCKGEININNKNCKVSNEGKQTRLPFPEKRSNINHCK